MFKCFESSRIFSTCKWGAMYMTWKRKLYFMIEKLKLKVVSIFWYDLVL
jgi:hypothetical protein